MFSFFKKNKQNNFDIVDLKLQKKHFTDNYLQFEKVFYNILNNKLNINKHIKEFEVFEELKTNRIYETIDNNLYLKNSDHKLFYKIRYFIISDDGIFKNVRITLIDENKQFHIIIDSNTFDDLISNYEYKGKKAFINYDSDISNDVYFNNNEYIKKYINMITFSPIKYHRFLQLIHKNTVEK